MLARWLVRTGTAVAGAAAVAAALTAARPHARTDRASSGVGPAMQSIGPLSFGPQGVLYAADPMGATIYALDLGASARGGAQGTANVDGIDMKLAAMLGTDSAGIAITDLAVDARTRNSYIAVMRGRGADSKPVMFRVDGAGKIEMVAFDAIKFTSVALPNPVEANPTPRGNPRMQAITDMAFQDGKLYVAGLSNEEFSSKLWAVPYPFANADRGASVEIFHGNHGRLETRSPVYTFVPYAIGNEPYLIGGYLCTPLVKFPLSSLAPGAKVRGTTIAELGARNRPIDMVLYKKGGAEYLLMANTARGVMKIPTGTFGTEPAITEPVEGTAGVKYETVASMTGVQQLDLLDANRVMVLARGANGALNLQSVPLP